MYGDLLVRRTIFISALILAITAITIAAFLGYQNAKTAVSMPPVKSTTVPASRGDVVKTVTAPGQLVGIQERMLGVDVDGRCLLAH
jgi:multidrug efflux pump subunit AcrA (membrane-fusion protein)